MKGVLWCARSSEAKDGVHIKGTGPRSICSATAGQRCCSAGVTHVCSGRDQFVSPEEKLGRLWRPAAITSTQASSYYSAAAAGDEA